MNQAIVLRREESPGKGPKPTELSRIGVAWQEISDLVRLWTLVAIRIQWSDLRFGVTPAIGGNVTYSG